MSLARWLGWAAFALLVMMMATGYGITEFRAVTSLTFGVLNKPISQNMHLYFGIPLLAVLVLHVGAAYLARRRRS